jgi:hypothetical protein
MKTICTIPWDVLARWKMLLWDNPQLVMAMPVKQFAKLGAMKKSGEWDDFLRWYDDTYPANTDAWLVRFNREKDMGAGI